MKYNVRLHNTKNGITTADVTWATDLGMGDVVDAVAKLLWFKEKNPQQFEGNIIVEPQEKEIHIPDCEVYNGNEEEVPETYLRPGSMLREYQ